MRDDSFVLHERLQADTHHIGRFVLCDLILMNESRYPWFILVPRRSGVSEIFELSIEDQQQLLLESSALSSHLSIHYHPDKLNIAAIGNIVPQLHIHHIVRYESDPAWPRPVWGLFTPQRYTQEKLKRFIMLGRFNALLGLTLEFL